MLTAFLNCRTAPIDSEYSQNKNEREYSQLAILFTKLWVLQSLNKCNSEVETAVPSEANRKVA